MPRAKCTASAARGGRTGWGGMGASTATEDGVHVHVHVRVRVHGEGQAGIAVRQAADGRQMGASREREGGDGVERVW